MGERAVDGRADLYALGIVGYQMLAGELPFQATNTPAMLMKHLSERPRPLSQVRDDLPSNLVHAIDRALEKGPDQRWGNAAEFRAALADDAPLPAPPRRSRASGANLPAVPAEPHGSSIEGLELLRLRTPLPAPPFPLPSDWLSDPGKRDVNKEALRQWREETRKWKEQVRGQARAMRPEIQQAARELSQMALEPRRPDQRIARTRKKLAGGVVTIGVLAAINLVTSPFFPWVIFPAIGIGFGIVRSFGELWADGIPMRQVFKRPKPEAERDLLNPAQTPLRRLEPRIPGPPAQSVAEAVLDAVPRDVLAGPHGTVVRETFEARAQIRSLLARLPETEKQLLPEILPTVEALTERVRTLAIALHALDTDASPESLVRLQARISEAEALPDGAPERERRLELLTRQFATLTDLAERRTALARQQEHAVLVLTTMKLDLMKLRSSGVESRLADQGPLTEEMRALARDVQRVAEAVDESRDPGAR
jgi:serine/threonine-protein kinase